MRLRHLVAGLVASAAAGILRAAAVDPVAETDVPCRHRSSRRLRNGVKMPRVSFGTAGLPRGDGHVAVVSAALDAGFRSFDTAMAREWYDERAVAKALNGSRVPRSALFITTKVHPRDLGFDATKKAVAESLAMFGTDYIDLVLLHYPRCFPGCACAGGSRNGVIWVFCCVPVLSLQPPGDSSVVTAKK